MVFRMGPLATDADVKTASETASRLRALLTAVGAAAAATRSEPQTVYAYLVKHMQVQSAAAAERAAVSASWAGPALRQQMQGQGGGNARAPRASNYAPAPPLSPGGGASSAAASAAPPCWPEADAALGGAAAAVSYGAAVGELRRCVRVKVQDNNDLALAARVVADACAFFDALQKHADGEGERPAVALKALRAAH
jgi:hypothetical protein